MWRTARPLQTPMAWPSIPSARRVDTDMVTNSLKFFPVGTGEDFRDLLLAIIAKPTRCHKAHETGTVLRQPSECAEAFGRPKAGQLCGRGVSRHNAFIFVP